MAARYSSWGRLPPTTSTRIGGGGASVEGVSSAAAPGVEGKLVSQSSPRPARPDRIRERSHIWTAWASSSHTARVLPSRARRLGGW